MKTLFRLAYVAWFCVLLGQFGVWHFIANLLTDTVEQQFQVDRANSEASELLGKCKEAANAKIAKGFIYTPDDYYKDYNKIRAVFKQHYDAKAYWPFHQQIGDLWLLIPKESRDSLNEQAACEKTKYGIGSTEALLIATKDNEKIRNVVWQTVVKEPGKILKYLFKYYFKYFFIFAFLLLLLDLQDKKLCLKSPVSFILNLFLYPFVILSLFWIFLLDKGREYYAEAQFRRRSGLWTVFSDNEIKLIKNLVQGDLKLSEIKKTIAANHPHARHSLLVALGATILIHAVPIKLAITAIEASTIVHLIQHEEGQVLKITHDGGGGGVKLFLDHDPGFLDHLAQLTSAKTIPESCWKQKLKIDKLSRKIDHIPLLTTKILNFSC